MWGAYRQIPVVRGQTNTVSVDLAEACQDLTSSSDTTVDCILALPGPSCGDPNADKRITASDALFALRAAVLLVDCEPSLCDVNGSDSTTAADALTILRRAVGISVPMRCPVS